MAKSASNALALLGGTFDPVHIGHLRMAIALRQHGFARVLMLPNQQSPHKQPSAASSEQRLAMLELALSSLQGSGLDGIHASDLELQRPAPSYSVDTLRELRSEDPQRSLTWVMGSDAWNSVDRWHCAQEIPALANLLVVSRPGARLMREGFQGDLLAEHECDAALLPQRLCGGIGLVTWPELDIASSDLRQAVKQGDNITFLTPDPVRDFILKHQLYR
ncbi:MAG TPA: nicotinate (nicotinamide) nucleotide adenylyltransferase [Oceanospirillales bacterium]|nr:nicotinate (nicotinamide) nucleotide adenylyltransferase [Oceanospirillaceae bacterium]HBS42551.1 nicotinate (nicotinamide) nucleotide adenylyltransferase [Oceanospirillales bacterium]|tara:strand:+ start:127 stop:783 length:657 start_codon:yes stop_codon:yes gene_type:complete